ncbi:hypothetical protein E2320_001102 [Naja naja]|nr:hypothetical protein E2320_001102 [Naja naja]
MLMVTFFECKGPSVACLICSHLKRGRTCGFFPFLLDEWFLTCDASELVTSPTY